MSDLPEGGITLDWIGHKLIEIQREQRAQGERLTRVEQVQEETTFRLKDIESALFRVDAVWRDIQAGIREVLRYVRPRVEQP